MQSAEIDTNHQPVVVWPLPKSKTSDLVALLRDHL